MCGRTLHYSQTEESNIRRSCMLYSYTMIIVPIAQVCFLRRQSRSHGRPRRTFAQTFFRTLTHDFHQSAGWIDAPRSWYPTTDYWQGYCSQPSFLDAVERGPLSGTFIYILVGFVQRHYRASPLTFKALEEIERMGRDPCKNM